MIVEYLSNLASHANFTTAVVFLIVAYVTWKIYDGYNLPPGPWGLPVVGYLPFMAGAASEVTFKNLSKKYGDVISVYFGSTLIVVINSYEQIKEAYIKQGDNFAGRPDTPLLKIDDDEAGVFLADGEPWREHRRFILSTLRDYGMGKLSLEPRIQEEIHFFLDAVAKEKGNAFDMMDLLGLSTANIISTLEFGKRFDYKDGRFVRLRKMQIETFDLFSNKDPRPFFPWVEYLPFSYLITGIARLRQINNSQKLFIRDMVSEHAAEYTENSKKDLIDAVLTERKKIEKKMGDLGSFGDKEVEGTLLGLFSAGTETTTMTLRWGLLFLMIHPEIQKKVQKEIDEVIGMERDPTMSDGLNMVYTQAVLLEIQRCASLVPLNVPHATHEETILAGYRIPKRAVIFTNLWAVHYDPNLWDEPDKFNPERFINKDGKLEKPDFLIPFGIGKRACVGESLAKMELFLYFTSMLQRFSFQPPKGVTPKLVYESSFARFVKPYKLCAIQRPGYSVVAN